jgi:predicted nucleotidyltransferase
MSRGTPIEDGLCRVSEQLRGTGVSFALLGGLAVSARTEPRFTRDIDLAISVVDDRQAERLVTTMRGLGYEVEFLVEQEAVSRLATVRLSTGSESFVVDLLFASSGIEQEVVASADPIEVFPGVTVPVASRASLIALKVLSRDDDRRPQDAIDLRALGAEATPDDWREAERLCELITSRGYHRDRDLHAFLSEVRARAS